MGVRVHIGSRHAKTRPQLSSVGIRYSAPNVLLERSELFAYGQETEPISENRRENPELGLN